MRKIHTTALCLVTALALLGTAPALLAQEPQMFHVSVNQTQLGHAPDYEAGIKRLFAAANKGGFSAPILASSSISSPGEYTFVVPISSWGDLDSLYANWNKTLAADPDLMGKLNEINTSTETSVWASRPDLSYAPASPRLTNEQSSFSRIVWIYPHPDQVAAIEGVINELGAINKKHEITDPYQVFQQIVGADGPVIGVMVSAKDELDYHTESAKNQKKTAADIQPLLAKMGPMMRRIEFTDSMRRTDLAYQP